MVHKKNIATFSIYLVLVIGSIVMILPLTWMVLTSLKSFQEILISPEKWIPERLQWHNYVEALTTFDFLLYLKNSLFVTTMIIAGTLISTSLSAYAFACLYARWGNVIFGILLSTIMLPGQITIIPVFQLFVKLGWINTYYPLIVPAWLGTNAFSIFLLRQFFKTIPKDYIDAGRIDGASEVRILWDVFIPLSKPALLTITVFTFIGSWNDLWSPLIFIHKEKLYTLPIALINFIGITGHVQGTPWHLIMAVSTVMMIPIIVLFFIAQRKFIEGISMTGLKA
ncbi:MAG: carbohydrate ABC transporter permease [bacterium]|nr:carbohydrate ABC transporter permease [bacterium]